MDIINKQMAYNYNARRETIKYIVIHDTGNPDAGADAMRNFQYFNTGNRGSSADFFVDDTQIVRANDYTKNYSWHCGDGHGKYGITNGNSVGIEICINSDGDYNKAFDKAVELTKCLMSELGIGTDHVVRHYDASRKDCPATMHGNNWALWQEFKNRIIESEDTIMSKEYEELKQKNEAQDEIINQIGQDIANINAKIEPVPIYDYIDDNMPDWARPTITKLVSKGFLQGDENGKLGLTEDLMRMLVINDRAGVYGE